MLNRKLLLISFLALCLNSYASVPLNLALVPCKGTYALCYYAKCKLNADGTASCGCHKFDDKNTYSFVDVNHIYPPELQEDTLKQCPYGLASCPNFDAPICQKLQGELLSTFNVGTPIFHFVGTKQCGMGKFADCMTAKCEQKTAFDGSPITCTCRVVEAEYDIAKTDDATCKLENGLIWSGTDTPK